MIKIMQDFEWYYQNGYITSRDGNACVRLDDAQFLVTASGAQKHELDSQSYVIVNHFGAVVEAPYDQKPSIETGAHLSALKASGRKASVHVHSPNTVALAALFEGPGYKPGTRDLIQVFNTKWPELFRYTKVAEIPPFFAPGSKGLHDSIITCLRYFETEFIRGTDDVEEVQKFKDIVILQRHGVLAIGDSLEHCREHIVRLEHISSILLKIIAASGGRLESIL